MHVQRPSGLRSASAGGSTSNKKRGGNPNTNPQEGKRKSSSNKDKDFLTQLHEEEDIHEISKFNPYKLHDNNSEIFNKGIPMVFFSSPRMNLVKENIERDSFFMYMNQIKPDLFASLNYSNLNALSSGRPFIPILSNRFKGIQLADTQTTMKEFHETFYGYKQNLPVGNVNSISGGEISVEFQENKNIDIIHLVKAWADYIEGVTRGYFFPSEEAKGKRFIDYTSSIYYFLLDFDGETILHYSKYSGCFPINVPYDVFSQNVGEDVDVPQVSVNFAYSYKEDMNPDILVDLNTTSTMHSTLANATGAAPVNAPIRGVSMDGNYSYDDMYPTNTGDPYVVMGGRNSKDPTSQKYRLRFL